ncbi:TPA: hypothetical protein JG871_003928 [Enterobacter hormaechei subsp. xiangfangensis]|nr:hypothetical protein [Enterobacter hormaechei subsp. xiangfangensis]
MPADEKPPVKKGPGAPQGNTFSLKGDVPATAHLHMRITPEEKAEFQDAADKAGLKLSEWVLTHLRKALKKAK